MVEHLRLLDGDAELAGQAQEVADGAEMDVRVSYQG